MTTQKIDEKDFSFFFRIWVWIARLFMWLYVMSYVYTLWSMLHQAIFDRKYRDVPVTLYYRLQELSTWLKGFKWHADGWIQLWDAVCSPGKVQSIGQMTLAKDDPHGNDCDDAAHYGATAISKSLSAGNMKADNIERAYYMFVVWFRPSGASVGHAITLIQYTNKKYAYMDYGDPSLQFDSISEVAELVRATYADKNTPYASVLWALFDGPSLAPLTVNFK